MTRTSSSGIGCQSPSVASAGEGAVWAVSAGAAASAASASKGLSMGRDWHAGLRLPSPPARVRARAFRGMRSGGRVVEGARLESEYTAKPYRGFESLPLRHRPQNQFYPRRACGGRWEVQPFEPGQVFITESS